MTINVRISGDFHRELCPFKEDNPRYQDCSNKERRLDYRCSKCVARCLKCEVPRLKANSPYIRGCQEARLAAIRTFSCVCVQYCEV